MQLRWTGSRWRTCRRLKASPDLQRMPSCSACYLLGFNDKQATLTTSVVSLTGLHFSYPQTTLPSEMSCVVFASLDYASVYQNCTSLHAVPRWAFTVQWTGCWNGAFWFDLVTVVDELIFKLDGLVGQPMLGLDGQPCTYSPNIHACMLACG